MAARVGSALAVAALVVACGGGKGRAAPSERDRLRQAEQIAPATPPVEVAVGVGLGKTLGVVLGVELDKLALGC